MRRNSDDKKPLFWIKCEKTLDLGDTRGGLSILIICVYDYTTTSLSLILSLSAIYIYYFYVFTSCLLLGLLLLDCDT